MKELARRIRSCKSICVLTGAGISAPSNVPTFRGKDGMWTDMKSHGTDPLIFLTWQMFRIDPTVLWNWLVDFRELVDKAKPNAAHHAVLKLQEHYKRKGKEFTLITQNIDNFHPLLIKQSELLKPKKELAEGEEGFGFTEGVLEIHGNEEYIRCSEECNLRLYKYPKELKKDIVPKCPKCGAPMRPHILLFDEIYRESLYKSDTAINVANTSDCMIVVGSELATNLPNFMVNNHIAAEKLLIDINVRESIAYNSENIKCINESCEKVLPELVEEVINHEE